MPLSSSDRPDSLEILSRNKGGESKAMMRRDIDHSSVVEWPVTHLISGVLSTVDEAKTPPIRVQMTMMTYPAHRPKQFGRP